MFVLEMLKTNFNKTFYLLAILIFLQSNNLFGKSNDSPDLDKISKNKISWKEWVLKTKNDLKNKNFKHDTLNYLDNIKFNPKVIELDRKQPEFRLTFDKYFKNGDSSKFDQFIIRKQLSNIMPMVQNVELSETGDYLTLKDQAQNILATFQLDKDSITKASTMCVAQ